MPNLAGKFYSDSIWHQYQVCFLYAMIINKGKNNFPYSALQAGIDTFVMLFGIAVYGHFLGSFKEIKFEMAEVTLLCQKIANSSE